MDSYNYKVKDYWCTKDDLRQVDIDGFKRTRGFLDTRRPYSKTRDNEYLRFLVKCVNHAHMVGDKEIVIIIAAELSGWRYVDEGHTKQPQPGERR